MTRSALLAATGVLMPILVSAQPAIHLRTRDIAAARRMPNSPRLVPGRHQIVQFRSYPEAAVLEQLALRGIQVLEYIPDNALMVSATRAGGLDGLDVVAVGFLEPSDKIAPGLADAPSNRYLAIFHADVGAARARALASASGFDILEHAGLSPGHLVLAGPFHRIAALAARDELAYVMPASPALISGARVLPCPGPMAIAGRVAEYAQAGSGWPKDPSGAVALTYVLQALTVKVESNAARTEIERALREWTKYANLSLSEGTSAEAARTLAIKFASGSHGDNYPFDGPGNVLSHTFYPAPMNGEPLAGDIHLDADEDWRIGSGVDIFSVALHEAGHALGLAHSTDPTAVMYPYYRLATGLADDDIAAIQSLYGPPVSSAPAPPAIPDPGIPTVPVVPPVPAAPVTPPGPTVPSAPAEPALPSAPAEPPTVPTVPTSPAAPTNPALPPATPPPAPPSTPPADVTSPSLRIVTPGTPVLSTMASALTVAGSASDDVGVTSVRWFTGTGSSGFATGTTTWSAAVHLLTGTNVITIRAYDAAGNSGWRSIIVVKP